MEKISIDHVTNSVNAVFDTFIKEDNFKKIAMKMLDEVKSSGKNKILCDTSRLKVMPISIQNWINEIWFSSANQLGVTHMAFIAPDSIFGKVSMEQTNSKKDKIGNIKIEYFNEVDKAKDWLKNLNH